MGTVINQLRPRVPPRTRPRIARGFTLIELVLVMVLLGTILAIAMPMMSGFWTRSRSRDAATQLLAMTQYARARAAADVRPFRLNFNDSSYWVTAGDPATNEYSEIGSEMGRPITLPQGMRLELLRQSAGSSQKGGSVIDFYPNGRADVATVRLIDARGDVITIASPSPAEPFRLLTVEEAARQ